MKKNAVRHLLVASLFVLAILWSGCTPSTEEPAPEVEQLATARVSAQLSDEPGRVRVIGHNDLHYFVDAAPSADGISEVDTLLAAQATCAVFVAEKAAQELDIPLNGATATTTFDEDQDQVNVYLDLPGANGDQVLDLANHFRQRCPIYTTLSEAASVEFSPDEQFEAGRNESAIVTAELFRFGGANVTTGNYTFVMDSVPPLDGPNEELNPLDMMLGGLAACSSFVYDREAAAANVTVIVEGDFDPSGVRDPDGPNPRIQNIRISLQTDSYDEVQAEKVEGHIKEQCHLYSMLNGTVDIEIIIEPA